MKILYLFSVIFLLIIFSCKENISNNDLKTEENNDKEISEPINIDSLNLFKYWNYYSYNERRGKSLYDNYCAVCHGVNGEGDGFNSYNLNPKPHSFADSSYMVKLSEQVLSQIISLGGRSINKSVMMPQYSGTFTDDEMEWIIDYIRTFHQKR